MKEYKKAYAEVIDFAGADVISASSTYAAVATTMSQTTMTVTTPAPTTSAPSAI